MDGGNYRMGRRGFWMVGLKGWRRVEDDWHNRNGGEKNLDCGNYRVGGGGFEWRGL